VYDIDSSRSGIPQEAVNPALDISGPQRHDGSGAGQANADEENQLTWRSKW